MGTDPQHAIRQDGTGSAVPAQPGEAHAPLPAYQGTRVSRLEPAVDIMWVAIGLYLCLYSQTLGVWGPSGPDSGFFPMAAGALVLVCGVSQLLGARRRNRGEYDPPFWEGPGASRRVIALVAGMVALVVLVRHAGFVIASLVMMPFLLRLVEKRSWRYAVTVGIVTTLAVHVVFGKLLGMQMPRGPWGF